MHVRTKLQTLLTASLTLGVCAAAHAEVVGVDNTSPLSSMVAVTAKQPIPVLVKKYVKDYAKGKLAKGVEFPLANTTTDTVRAIPGLSHNVVVRWLEPLTNDPNGPRFGANCDFIAYLGDGWNDPRDDDDDNDDDNDDDRKTGRKADAVASSPQISGSSTKGWIWSNHEYISGFGVYPRLNTPPLNQHLTLATFLERTGKLPDGDVNSPAYWTQANVDAYIKASKKEVGGSWFRVTQNQKTGKWSVDRSAPAVRYDATSGTLVSVKGYNPADAVDDQGNALPGDVVVGITGDCSGGLTPWGTVFTAEENVQDYYGDLEIAWTSNNRFNAAAVGFQPGTIINPSVAPSTSGEFGRSSEIDERKPRDNYGFLVEVDPGVAADKSYTSVAEGGDGKGHRKLGNMGRARWENAAFAVGSDFQLVDGQPAVIYGGDDRRSGRVFKWVSNAVYRTGMNRGQVRALLESGKLYVAQFTGIDHTTGVTMFDTKLPPTEAQPGQGQWIELSVNNTSDVAPNADGLGQPGKTVGEALSDINWNGIGGFPNDQVVKSALFTASNKLGIVELNRPEDTEYNPNDLSGEPRIYIAFTNHNRPAACNQAGVLSNATPNRTDEDGSIFTVRESDPTNPGASNEFTFWMAWQSSRPVDNNDPGTFAAGDPDNIAVDKEGGVFFGTDGYYDSTGRTRADAIYYLDTDPAHKAGNSGVKKPTYGLAFRLIAGPADSEQTGPWLTPNAKTLFFNVQHPGEEVPSTWPQNR